MVAALHKDGESITKLEKADVLGRNKGVISEQLYTVSQWNSFRFAIGYMF